MRDGIIVLLKEKTWHQISICSYIFGKYGETQAIKRLQYEKKLPSMFTLCYGHIGQKHFFRDETGKCECCREYEERILMLVEQRTRP